MCCGDGVRWVVGDLGEARSAADGTFLFCTEVLQMVCQSGLLEG